MARPRMCGFLCFWALQLSSVASFPFPWSRKTEEMTRAAPVNMADSGCNVGDGKWSVSSKAQSYRVFSDPSQKEGAEPGPHWCSLGSAAMSRSSMCTRNEVWQLKWEPTSCELEPVYGPWFRDFAERKPIAFVGDGIIETQYKSLNCLLHGNMSHVDMYLANRFGAEPGAKGNVNLENVDISKVFRLTLRKPTDYSVIVIGGGHHFDHKEIKHTLHGEVIENEEGGSSAFVESYRVALKRVLKQLEKNGYKKDVILMSWVPKHQVVGGKCASLNAHHLERVDEVNTMLRKLAKVEHSFKITLVDVTSLSLDRFDGHPGVMQGGFIDCTHWCAPGVPDMWNRVLTHALHGIADAQI